MTKSDIYREIAQYYENLRVQNNQKYLKNKQLIYSEIPQIEQLDLEIKSIGLDTSQAVLNSEPNTGEKIENMSREIDRISREKKALLTQYGYSYDMLKPVYTCEKCKDTGVDGTKRCSCFLDILSKLIYENSGLSNPVNKDFDSFVFDYYSKVKDQKWGLSPYDNAVSILQMSKDFAYGNSEYKNLLFSGNTGLGKTFLSDCIAREFAKRGKMVFYISAPTLFNMLSSSKFGKGNEEENAMNMKTLNESDLLIIDDLGTELKNNFTDSSLFELINNRLLQQKSMIISTNFDIVTLGKSYSERISSRILGEFEVVKFFGDDIRKKIKGY